MRITLADQSTLTLLGAQGIEEYISGQRCKAIRFCFDAETYQDPQLRESFCKTEKTQTMAIDDGALIEGYTVLVRTVYEGGQIRVVMAQNKDAAAAKLQDQVTAQQEAISILMGGTNNG